MKKILLYGSTAAVLMLLASCSVDNTEPSVPATRTITRTFPVDETVYSAHDTRTAYENGQIGFTNNEQLGAYVWTDAGASANAGMATRTAGSPSTVTVTHNALSNNVDYNYVFVYPYKYGNSLYRNTPTVVLNGIQHPTPTTFDPVQDILVSKPVKATGNGGTTTSEALPEIQFKRLFTFFRLKIDRSKFTGDIKFADGEKIQSVTITAPDGTELAGTARVDIDEAYDATTCKFTIPTNTITADYGTDGEAFNADGTFDVWFVVNPVTFNGLTIEVRTSAQTITQTFNEQVALDFKASGINALTFQSANNANISTVSVAALTDYYTDGVEINGIRYDGTSENARKLTIKADATDNTSLTTSGGVVFLEDLNNTGEFVFETTSSQGISKDLIIIGNNPSVKANVNMQAYWALRNPSGILAFKNLKIDMTEITAGYVFNAQPASAINGLNSLIFEDCEITFNKTFLTMYNAHAEAGIENIIFRNCKICYTGTSNTFAFITTSKLTTGLSKFQSLVFENNVIYAKTSGSAETPTAFSFLVQDNDSSDGALENLAIRCTNNTLIDIISYGTSTTGCAYFNVEKFGSIEFSKNVAYSQNTEKNVTVMRVRHDYNAVGNTWPLYNLGRTENIFYGAIGWKQFDDAKAIKPVAVEANGYTKKNESPMSEYDPANGVFKTTSACDGFGSTLLY